MLVHPQAPRVNLARSRRIVDPREETMTVYRWTPEGYLVALRAERGERVRAEPFDAIELQVGVLFGDEREDE